MGKRGAGYGSEDHLRRYLAERPETLGQRATKALGTACSVKSLDFPATKSGTAVREIEFLEDTKHAGVIEEWKAFWPTRGRSQTWDLVGHACTEWVLAEAKASWPEFVTTRCKAEGDGLRTISKALRRVQRDLGVDRWFDWTETYYQACEQAGGSLVLTSARREGPSPGRLLHW